jgi:hypothetical protein
MRKIDEKFGGKAPSGARPKKMSVTDILQQAVFKLFLAMYRKFADY